MKTIRLIAIGALAACLFACSSGSSTNGPGSEETTSDDSGTASSGAGASGGSSGSSGSSGSGGSSGGNASSSSGASSSGSSGGSSGSSGSGSSSGGVVTGDAAPMDNPEIDYSVAPVTLTMTPFTVAAGAEVYYCQNFANPWGKSVDVKTYALDMSPGSHHMFAFYQNNATDGAIGPCPNAGLTFAPFTFGAQSPTLTETYPATVGATIPAGTGFQVMVHYLNTTGSQLTSSVKLTMYVAKPNVVTNHAGQLFLNQPGITVPATGCTCAQTSSKCTVSPQCQATASYTLTQDVNILAASSHMHKYGTNFIASTSTGKTLYQTQQWSEPVPLVYSPALLLKSGTTITWTCTDVNTTGQKLTFGESALTNVMCISTSTFYPVLDVNNPVIGAGT